MAQSQQQQAAPQRISLGRWAFKKWFPVKAPMVFGGQVIAEVPAEDPGRLIGRNIEVTLYDITRDLTHINTKLRFKITSVDSSSAYTMFNGMELTRDYVRNLIRRGSSRIMAIKDVATKDGARLRFEVLAITTYRCNRSHKHAIRRIIFDILDKRGPESTFDDLVKASVMGQLSLEFFNECKKIYPLRKVEVMKIKVLKPPEAGGAKPTEEVKVAEAAANQQAAQAQQ